MENSPKSDLILRVRRGAHFYRGGGRGLGADWGGFWDDRVLPRFSYYDWVRYASYTPGNGDTGTNNNFTYQWQDDFNEFDTTRWEKNKNVESQDKAS